MDQPRTTMLSLAASDLVAPRCANARPEAEAAAVGAAVQAADKRVLDATTLAARRVILPGAAALLTCVLFSGCAAITNPIAHGVPVRMIPEELLAESREGYVPLPLTLLRQEKPDEYLLAPGDTLGVYIEGVIGSEDTPPPVNIPPVADIPPSIGYPLPVRADGTISLPFVGAIDVEGLTIEAAEQNVVDAYSEQEITRDDTKRILVTLLRPRTISVIVIREDSAQRQVSLRNESLLGLGTTETTIGGGRQGTGEAIELPAYENDVLHALSATGGLPGLESTREVIIQRGYWRPANDGTGQGVVPAQGADRPQIIRIPLRIRPGEQVTFTPDDILLHSGDIVTVEGRDPEFYYTGGLLPSGEFPLPPDYDLTVVEAMLKARGPLLNGGLNTSNLNGQLVNPGLGNPSPNLLTVLRKTPGNGQVQIRVDLDEAVRDPRLNLLVESGDILVLQETPDQAIARYFSQMLRFDLFGRVINRNDAQGSISVTAP